MSRVVIDPGSPQVSGIGLGTMQWGRGPLSIDADEVSRILDVYTDHGGNLIDTAPLYGAESSAEETVGALLEGRRDDYVLVTKVGGRTRAELNTRGLNRRSVVRGVHDSLRRLRTDYLDYVLCHVYDAASVDRVWVDALATLVERGDVLGWGVSNFPAWAMAEAVCAAPPARRASICQVPYSILDRDIEHEILPAAEHFGLGVLAYSPLGGGLLARAADGGAGPSTLSRRGLAPTAERLALAAKVDAVARSHGRSPVEVAVSWVCGKGAVPIIGGRTARQVQEAMRSRELPPECITELDHISAPQLRYPSDFIAQTREFFGI